MNEKINNLMVYAIDAIKESGISDGQGNVSDEYKGYIYFRWAPASGRLACRPHLAFYSRKGDSGADKRKVLKAIMSSILNMEEQFNRGRNLLKFVVDTAKRAG
ncbi:MAG: hypothetical protein U5Q03_17485 [Bacteroidota bacterium]|nr:hypothetical protein [Bacteroidota bacterium]